MSIQNHVPADQLGLGEVCALTTTVSGYPPGTRCCRLIGAGRSLGFYRLSESGLLTAEEVCLTIGTPVVSLGEQMRSVEMPATSMSRLPGPYSDMGRPAIPLEVVG